MKNAVNPIVAVIVLAVAIIGVVIFLWTHTQGKTFTKSEAQGSRPDAGRAQQR